MPRIRQKPALPPLDSSALESLALGYVARFATSRSRLSAYLDRKLKERGWTGKVAPDLAALLDRLAAMGYVDDGAFAAMKGASLARRGYGARRVADSLRAAGITGVERDAALATARNAEWDAAQAFARRRRIGPFADRPAAREDRQKRIAAFLRAGHSLATAAAWVDALPGEPPDPPERDPERDVVDEVE